MGGREGKQATSSSLPAGEGPSLRARNQGHPHERLEAWKRSIHLVSKTYRFCAALPGDQKFVLVSQMQRAAVSVPSNLAEGSSRETAPDKGHFYTIARASLIELDTLLVVAGELGYAESAVIDEMRDDISGIGRMINGLIGYQRKRSSPK